MMRGGRDPAQAMWPLRLSLGPARLASRIEAKAAQAEHQCWGFRGSGWCVDAGRAVVSLGFAAGALTACFCGARCLQPEEEEEDNMGDVDLWSVVDDGKALTVNAKWLQHLQVCGWGPRASGRTWKGVGCWCKQVKVKNGRVRGCLACCSLQLVVAGVAHTAWGLVCALVPS